jgi:hypothetical protein
MGAARISRMTWSILAREPQSGALAAAVVRCFLPGRDNGPGMFDREVIEAAIARQGVPQA